MRPAVACQLPYLDRLLPEARAVDPHINKNTLDVFARFKRPKDYVFLDQLPKNNYGKVLKTVLRESFK